MANGSYWQGLLGEQVACLFLQKLGYVLVAKRVKTQVGEIDLIMREGDVLVFVEIKKRRELRDAMEALSKRQFKRIVRAAEVFLQQVEFSWCEIRFDLVCIFEMGGVEHMKNISFNYEL